MLAASTERVLHQLRDDAVVLDVGGWAKPFARADWVLDLLPYETRGLYGYEQGKRDDERFSADTWVVRDMCAREPWPFADDQFDFAICSHTLEDIRDPIWVCQELQRVARAGYIEVPSRLQEQAQGVQGNWVGWGHHHWLIDIEGDSIQFVFKHHIVHGDERFQVPHEIAAALTAAERVQMLWWTGSFEASERVFVEPPEALDDYLMAIVPQRGSNHSPQPPSPIARVRSTVALRTRWRELKYQRLLRRLAGPRLIDAFEEQYDSASVLEIGANDHIKYDNVEPLLRSGRWSGVLVEPVPYIFKRLEQRYADVPGVKLANVAIADRDGSLPFFYLAEAPPGEEDSLPDWYHEIGSFSRENVLTHARSIPGLEERIVEAQIPALTVASLFERNAVEHVDLVVIDTEGYDAEIVKAFPFDRYRPRLLVYEHFHLDDDVRTTTRALLHEHGYETMEEGLDTFAFDAGADDELTRRWRRLEPAIPGASKKDEAA
jgi:FkbM family methyltransferase